LSPSLPSTWTVWRKYPAHLPLRARRALLAGSLPSRSVEANRFLLDALASMKENELEAATGKAVIRAAAVLRQGQPDGFSLWEWAAWTQRRAEDYPFDPRVGEWTAVQIVCKALDESDPSGPFHWADILVPHNWITPDVAKLSWEKWKIVMTN